MAGEKQGAPPVSGGPPTSGGPVGINVKVEEPGVVVIRFDRTLDTMILQPVEVVQLCHVLLGKALAAGQGKVDSPIVLLH